MNRYAWLLKLPLAVFAAHALFGVAAMARAQSQAPPAVFVDGRIGADTCQDYDPASRACGSGTARAVRRLAALGALRPGDVVALREGDYDETLHAASGAAGAPITYTRYGEEHPRIRGAELDPAIDLSNVRYAVIDGLAVADVVGWVRAENAQHVVIRNSTFRGATASGSRAGLKFIHANDNRILDNVIDDGNDNVLLIDSNRNLVAGNRITGAGHALWTILCGSNNVIRGNTLENEWQKLAQVTDCEGEPSDTPSKNKSTRRNLVEDNDFGAVPDAGGQAPYSHIQYSAQQGIVRRNRFFDSKGSGLQMTIYDDEARYNTGNRVYHNVFYAIDIGGDRDRRRHPTSRTTSSRTTSSPAATSSPMTGASPGTDDLAGKPVQVMTARRDGYLFDNNDIFGGKPGAPYVVAYGEREGGDAGARSIEAWQRRDPKLFARNLEVDPGFAAAERRDFHLVADSPLIDRGAFLTSAAAAGSGTSLQVVGCFLVLRRLRDRGRGRRPHPAGRPGGDRAHRAHRPGREHPGARQAAHLDGRPGRDARLQGARARHRSVRALESRPMRDLRLAFVGFGNAGRHFGERAGGRLRAHPARPRRAPAHRRHRHRPQRHRRSTRAASSRAACCARWLKRRGLAALHRGKPVAGTPSISSTACAPTCCSKSRRSIPRPASRRSRTSAPRCAGACTW